MKRTALILLTIAILVLPLSPVFAETFDNFQQLMDSLSSGAYDNCSSVTVVYYTETTTYDCNGNVVSTVTQPATQNTGTVAEMMDWINTQVNTTAVEPTQTQSNSYSQSGNYSQAQSNNYSQSGNYSQAQNNSQTWGNRQYNYNSQTWGNGQSRNNRQSWNSDYSWDATVFYTARPASTPNPQQATNVQTESRPSSYQTGNNSGASASGITANPAGSTVSTGDYTTTDASTQEQKLLNLINEDRAKNGLPALTLDPELSKLAQLKSDDMNSNNYFAHESPTYGTAGQMLDSFNYNYQGVGENIAHHSNVEKAEAAFMSSDGHRHNILGSQWDKVGIGISVDQNGYVYVTELFAR